MCRKLRLYICRRIVDEFDLVVMLKTEPMFDPLGEDPGFVELCDRLDCRNESITRVSSSSHKTLKGV